MSSTTTTWTADSNTKASSSLSTTVTDVKIAATSKLYLDGGGNTYIVESSADVLDIYVGGNKNISAGASTLQINTPLVLGVDDTGYDVTFFGATSGKKLLWDESADELIFIGNGTKLSFYDAAGGENISANASGVLSIAGGAEIDLTSVIIDINATTTCTIDNTNTSNGVAINTATSGGPISIGHATSETTVNDNLTVSGDLAVTGGITVAGTSAFDIGDSDKLLLGDGDDLQIYHDGSHAYINNSTGFLYLAASTSGIAVTIGHTTSETKINDNLTVTGTTALNDNITVAENKKLYFDSTDTYIYADTTAAEILYIGSDDDIILQPDDDLIIQAGTTEYVRFDGANQRIGIGTNTPQGPLHIVETGATTQTASSNANTLVLDSSEDPMGMTFLSQAGEKQSIHFGDTDDNDIGRIEYDHVNNNMVFHTNASEAMRIDENGYLGIGNTNPDKLFHIESDSYTTAMIEAHDDRNWAGPFLHFQRSQNTAASPTVVDNSDVLAAIDAFGWDGDSYQRAGQITCEVDEASGTTVADGVVPCKWVFDTQAGAVLSIVNNGNVGIGTTTPDGLLHIKSAAEGDVADTGTNVAQLVVESTGSTAGSFGPTLALLNSSTAVDNDLVGVLSFLGDSATADATGDTSNSTTYGRMYGRILDEADGAEIGALYMQASVAGSLSNHIYMASNKVGIHTAAPSAALHVDQASASGAKPVLKLDQADVDDSFIDFIGTTASDQTKSITTDTTVGSLTGHIKIEVNGTAYWLPFYAAN